MYHKYLRGNVTYAQMMLRVQDATHGMAEVPIVSV
jgi:hypothetical protein